jgi:hypothetical protein
MPDDDYAEVKTFTDSTNERLSKLEAEVEALRKIMTIIYDTINHFKEL